MESLIVATKNKHYPALSVALGRRSCFGDESPTNTPQKPDATTEKHHFPLILFGENPDGDRRDFQANFFAKTYFPCL